MKTARPRCPTCERPLSTCLCRWVTPVVCRTEVFILQHPLEVNHAKNTARLLHLSLPSSHLRVGESFGEADLGATGASRSTVLLYPVDEQPLSTAQPWDAGAPVDPDHLRLVVLDGTWRKSRKMLHLSPWLQGLPRLSLEGALPSAYLIRRAHKPGQLSTLEATCAALAQLEGCAPALAPLLRAFDGFVAQQLAHWPQSR